MSLNPDQPINEGTTTLEAGSTEFVGVLKVNGVGVQHWYTLDMVKYGFRCLVEFDRVSNVVVDD